jgi:hypothetical protein
VRNAPWKKATVITTAPYSGALAVYGVVKLIPTYAGPCMRVVRDSDSAESDINFIGTALDTTTLNTFRSGSTLRLKTLYDQTGSGLHTTQAVSANRPLLLSDHVESGVQGITFDSVPDRWAFHAVTVSKYMDLPAGVSINRAGCTIARCVHQPFSASRSGHYEFDSTVLDFCTYTETAVGIRNIDTSLVRKADRIEQALRCQPWVMLETCTASALSFYSSNNLQATSGRSSLVMNGGRIGVSTFGSGYYGMFDLYAFAVYPTALSPARCTDVVSWLEVGCGVVKNQSRQLVIAGNSRFEGYDSTLLNTFGRQLVNQLSHPVRYYNQSKGGRTIALLLADAPTHVYPLADASLAKNILLLGDPTNDFTAGRLAVDVETDVQAYCAGARTAGFDKIAIVTSMVNASQTTGEAAEQTAYNTWLRANYASFADGLIDLAADSRLQTPNDGVYFADDKHQTSVGQGVEAALAAPVINAWL